MPESDAGEDDSRPPGEERQGVVLNHREKKSYSKIKQHTMKKRIKIVGIVFVMAVLVWAMPESLAQVSVVNGSNQIRINYKMPRYTLAESEVNEVIGGNGFQFVSIQVSDEEYGVVADEGRPQLPQRTLFLAVPSNAVDFQVRMTGAVQGTRSLPAGTYVEPYMDIDPENPVWEFDKAYYITSDTSYLEQFYEVEECFTMMGERILPVTLLPFRYVPKKGVVEELRSASFIVTWNLQGPAGAKQARSRLKESYVSTMVDNYDASKGGPVLDRVRYLIITASEFADEMAFFKEYKENLGYEVAMATTDQTGSSPASISAYIRNADPDFVLLVGDTEKIPYASGNMDPEAENNPMTDQGYRRFNDNKWSYGDVFLGRWPASSVTDVCNMIHKTIYMETRLHTMPKEAYLLAGHAKSSMERKSNNALDYAAEKGFVPRGYSVTKYYQSSKIEIEQAMKIYPAWFVYNGHGNFFSLAVDDESDNFITRDAFSRKDVYPMVFAFSCKSGNYANLDDENSPFGRAVMSQPYVSSYAQGAVSMFGSSVLVYSNNNKAITEKMMGDAFGERHLGIMVAKGMDYYGDRFWSRMNRERTFRALKSFNLMGDPSFLKDGSLTSMSQYVFSEKIVCEYPVDLEMVATDKISAVGGIALWDADLSFTVGNEFFLNGSVLTEETGVLKVSAGKKVEMGANTCIRRGSSVEITAGEEIVLQPGCIIEAGADVTLQVMEK